MTLMERNKQTVLVCAPPVSKDADAAPANLPQTAIRALVTPLLSGQKAYPFGLLAHERVQLLYDGPVDLHAGMRATLRPGAADSAVYAVQAVRRYPWMQAAELFLLHAEARP